MKKSKPSKQAGNRAKRESNYRDYKGDFISIPKERYNDLILSESVLLDMASFSWKSKWTKNKAGKEITEVNFTKSVKPLLKPSEGWQKKTYEMFTTLIQVESKAASELSYIIPAKIAGAEKTKQQKEKRYQIAKEIFESLEFSEKFPIKRSQIEKIVSPLWPKSHKLKAPKEKTLFDFQARYLKEKVKA